MTTDTVSEHCDPTNTYYWRLLPLGVTITVLHCLLCGQGSVDGIATGYWLDGPGIESRWRQDFPHLSWPALGPTQPPVQWVKSGRAVTLTPHPFWCRGHERVELYLYSPYGPYGLYRASVHAQGWPLPLLFIVFFSQRLENKSIVGEFLSVCVSYVRNLDVLPSHYNERKAKGI